MTCLSRATLIWTRWRPAIQRETPENIPFVRLEAGTNLIGGQPISYANMKAATAICHRHSLLTVLDASLLQDNLYFIKTREPGMEDKSLREITRMIADLFDIIYFSARKFGFARAAPSWCGTRSCSTPWRI